MTPVAPRRGATADVRLGAAVVMLGGIMALATLVLLVYSLVDIITSEDSAPHGLPKLMWLILVLLLPLAGSVAWLVVSRRAKVASRPRTTEFERARPEFPEYDRPGRLAAPDPEADAEFLRKCRERAEEQRRKAGGDNPDPQA